MVEISVVCPVYHSRECVSELVRRICEVVDGMSVSYEVMLIDDRCPENSWEIISEECERNNNVKGIRLSRNFGQHYAITAGLEESSGNWVVVMDADLQEDPKYIADLYAAAQQGHDVVFTKRAARTGHSFIRNVCAAVFARGFKFLLDEHTRPYDTSIGTMSMLNRKVVNAFLSIRDQHRHYLSILYWLGFNSTSIPVEHGKRYAGKSSYSVRALILHALNGIVSQSDRLLYYSVVVGFGALTISFLLGIGVACGYFFYGLKEGWPSLMVTILFGTGAMLIATGVNGLYIAKNFEQTKERPLFVIDQRKNIGDNGSIVGK